MKLYEYEAKEILEKYGVLTPKRFLAETKKQVRDAAGKLAKPVAIKAQILVAGRGKAGGILFADSVKEADKAAKKLFKTRIAGIPIKKVIVEEIIEIKRELYIGITVDRPSRKYVLISSPIGGMEIEEAAIQSPGKVLRTLVKPELGFRSFHARRISKKLGYKGRQGLDFAQTLKVMYRMAMDYDALICEINPLVETVEGKFMAADSRMIIDDNALFRHPEFEKRMFEEDRERIPQEKQAMEEGMDYIKLDGNIGIIGNGAGLVMATLDLIYHYGGRPANFLDLGGGATAERARDALKIVQSDPGVAVTLVNIFAGITHCDEIAHAIVDTKELSHNEKPIIIRLAGTNEEEGKRILENANINVWNTMEEAAEKAVQIAKR